MKYTREQLRIQNTWTYNRMTDVIVFNSLLDDLHKITVKKASKMTIEEVRALVPEEYYESVEEVYPAMYSMI